MSTNNLSALKRRSTTNLSALMDSKLAGRQVRWYLAGWRFGIIMVVVSIFLPFLLYQIDPSLIPAAIGVGIYVILALGLNIVVGYAGLLDLGYVAFFVIGSYTVAVGTGGILQSAQDKVVVIPSTSFWVLLPVAALVAGLFGVLLGAPTLRLRGDYLAIVTLGFGEIVPIVFQNVPYFFGAFGMSAFPPTDVGPIRFGDPLDEFPFYYLVLALVVIVILGVTSLRGSSIGRAWIAIREDETAAAVSGVNLVRTKLLAFGLGALVGGIGGALNASFVTTIAPSDFSFNISITVLVMIVLGGLGSIPGVILGAVILRFIDIYLLNQINVSLHASSLVADNGGALHFLNNVDLGTAKFLIYGLVLLSMILLRPQGLIPDVRRKRELQGIGASAESASAVGLFERAEASLEMEGGETTFAGAGSDAEGREG
ncbi:MAG: branched-chain amino acid ABC transporter permease [Ktedonobacterales bacterium]